VRAAGQLELSLREPVVLFSWPSQAKLKAYTVDECNAEWSLRPFQVFMQGMERKLDPDSIMTVSHSMGNRLLNWYLQSRFDKNDGTPPHFREIVLTSPDIDRATFKNYFFKIVDNADKTRVYISSKDVPLRFSRAVHGAYRAGSAEVPQVMHWEFPGNIKGAQTINFTNVDSGFLGHSIQYDIIASMHRNDTPGLGLHLEEDKSFKGDYVVVELDK